VRVIARDACLARLVIQGATHVGVAHHCLAAHPRQEEGHGLGRLRVQPLLQPVPARSEGAGAKDRLYHRPEARGARRVALNGLVWSIIPLRVYYCACGDW
jgi:hypothetical protein